MRKRKEIQSYALEIRKLLMSMGDSPLGEGRNSKCGISETFSRTLVQAFIFLYFLYFAELIRRSGSVGKTGADWEGIRIHL